MFAANIIKKKKKKMKYNPNKKQKTFGKVELNNRYQNNINVLVNLIWPLVNRYS